ncbi:MAG: hypothetical protein NVS1B14_09820 [Vulcanimicrobiaceae bacterium]
MLGVAAPAPTALPPHVVIARYASALAANRAPKNVVFTYAVSQVGFHYLEQIHRIFRNQTLQRDETISVDGNRVKIIRILRRADRYAISRIAPSPGRYVFVFVGTRRTGRHLNYVFNTITEGKTAFTVRQVVLDGLTFLPASIRFTSAAAGVQATGSIGYAKFGHYWMPLVATVSATVKRRATRERIAWGAYAFPAALPASTFYPPKPMPLPTVAPF